jgi:hypothetical protein
VVSKASKAGEVKPVSTAVLERGATLAWLGQLAIVVPKGPRGSGVRRVILVPRVSVVSEAKRVLEEKMAKRVTKARKAIAAAKAREVKRVTKVKSAKMVSQARMGRRGS